MFRHLSLLLTLLLLLAACGTAPGAQNPGAAPAAPEPSAAPAATHASAPANAPAATGATRTITHALGETEVPTNPQRIAVVGYNEVEELAALGITPIAVLYEIEKQLLPESFAQIPVIGNESGAPNLEKLLALKPDLILGVDWAMGEVYAELSQIAPSVVVPRPSFAVWKDALRFTADVVGRSEKAEELLAGYDQRVAEVRDAIGPEQLANTEVTAFRPYGDGSAFLIWIDRSFCDVIMADVGIRRPEAQREALPEGEERIDDLSLEMIPLLDADVIFMSEPWNDETAAFMTTLEANPLFQQLRAVQAGRVYPASFAWNEGSILSAHHVLDDLETHLGGVATPAADPAALVVLEETGQYRLIKHSLGESQVPLQPRRVVTLQDQNALLPLFDLGFRDVVGSVGAVKPDGSTYFRRMQNYDTSSVAYVGEYGTPNLEQIAALQPDLIVGSQYEVTPENYDLLSKIAPTVAVEQFTRPIWAHYDDFALLVNRTDEAQALKARFDARMAEVKAKLQNPGDITVSLFYVESPGKINAEADPEVPYHIVFDGLGLAQKPEILAARANGQFYSVPEAVSFELLPDFDADVIFVPYWGDSVTEDVQALQDSPLWQQLNAVKQNQAFTVPGEQWFGMSYQPMFNILDFIEANLANKPLDTSWEPAP
jgi:iron complex transport system substrate-binding protein